MAWSKLNREGIGSLWSLLRGMNPGEDSPGRGQS